MTGLNILSGGAVQGLVASLASRFRVQTGCEITGEFGAVGVMAEKLRSGTPTDLVILTSALIAQLAREGHVRPASIADIGVVETAFAVRSGDPKVAAHDAETLRDVLLAADAIYVPDMQASTAGLHVAKVLRELGIAETIASRLKIHPNGATAMRYLASSDAKRPIGCTQATEIVSTAGVAPSGALPRGYDLATIYTAAVTATAAHPDAARILINVLTSAESQDARNAAAFQGS